jgi:hypothetical protein
MDKKFKSCKTRTVKGGQGKRKDKMKKEKILGFWRGCACQLGGRIFEIDFPFFYDEFLLTRNDFEKEIKEKGYLTVEETCSFCRGTSFYVLFKEKDLPSILEQFPYLARLQKNYDFLKKRGYFEEKEND